MGTYYGLNYQGCALDQTVIEEALAAMNAAFSTYDPQSEISRFNRAGADAEVRISEHFAAPLSAARDIWSQTNGALDPTVGPLVDLWGFGPERSRVEPGDAEQESVFELIGWQKLNYQGRLLSKQVDGLRLDLSAIAKGYAVDVVAEIVAGAGCENYMVDIGGEMAVAGQNPEGRPWRVGIERPDSDALGAIRLVLEVTDLALATSGDYRNYRVVDGKRVDHVMDPRSGRPAENHVVSATVLHQQAMYADGYATAAMVLGVEGAMDLADKIGFALLIMTRTTDDSGAELHYNQQMEKHMVSSQ